MGTLDTKIARISLKDILANLTEKFPIKRNPNLTKSVVFVIIPLFVEVVKGFWF